MTATLAVVAFLTLLKWETPFLGCAGVEDAGAAFAVHEDVAAQAVVDCFAAAHGTGEGCVGWWSG